MNPSLKKIELTISGMHCASCANRLQKALYSRDGVISAEVNFGTELHLLNLTIQKYHSKI